MRDYRGMTEAGQQGAAPGTQGGAAGTAPGAAGPAEPEDFKPVLKPATAKRANATVIGMLMAVGVSLGLALILPLMSAHPSGPLYQTNVDVPATAGQAQGVAGFRPAAPALPDGWTANYARWTAAGSDGVGFWEVGYVTPSQKFITVTETAQANPTWLAGRTDNAPVTGDRTLSGLTWQLRDKPGTSMSLILNPTATAGSSTVVLRGEQTGLNELDVVANAVAAARSAAVPGASLPEGGK